MHDEATFANILGVS